MIKYTEPYCGAYFRLAKASRTPSRGMVIFGIRPRRVFKYIFFIGNKGREVQEICCWGWGINFYETCSFVLVLKTRLVQLVVVWTLS